MYDRILDLLTEKLARSKKTPAYKVGTPGRDQRSRGRFLARQSEFGRKKAASRGTPPPSVRGRQHRSDGADEGGAGSEGATATLMARKSSDPKDARS